MLSNFSIYILLVFTEILLRIFGVVETPTEQILGSYTSAYNNRFAKFHLGNRKLSNNSRSEFYYDIILNKEGFSNSEWQIEKSDSIFRIIGLGDSFTEGIGTNMDSTWLKFLERNINNSHFDFMNAGIQGNDPIYSYYNFQHKLIKYKPNIILCCVNTTDFYDIIARGGFDRFHGDEIIYRKAPAVEFTYACSHISRLVFNRYIINDLFLLRKKREVYFQEASLILEDCLLRFDTLCKNNQVVFVCVIHPIASEIQNNDVHHLNKIEDFCNQNSIKVINLATYFLENEASEHIQDYYWEIDGHHNARGYQLMGDGIYESLLNFRSISTDTVLLKPKPMP